MEEAIITGVFTIVGTVLGVILEKMSHGWRTVVSFDKIEFDGTDDILKVIKGSQKGIETTYGKVIGCTIFFNIINIADYQKFLQNCYIKINRKKYIPDNIYTKVEEDEYYKSVKNNSILLESKKYTEIKIFIPIEHIDFRFFRTKKIKICSKTMLFNRKIVKDNLKKMCNQYIKETNKTL